MADIQDELFELLLEDAAQTVSREEDEAARKLTETYAKQGRASLRFRWRLWRETERFCRRQSRRQETVLPQPRMHHPLRAAQAVILALILASAGAYANYRGMFQFLLHDVGTHTKVEFVTAEEADALKAQISPEWEGPVYYPAYIPEEYELAEVESDFSGYIFTYENPFSDNRDYIRISVLSMGGDSEIGVDTEDAEVESIMIQGMEGIRIKKRGWCAVFHDDQYLFIVRGNQISWNIIIKIAENLKT